MTTSTIQCNYFNPLNKEGNFPDNKDFWNYASSTCIIEQNTSSAVLDYNGFTYGEIIISFFAFLSFVVILYAVIFFTLRGIKIKQ